MLVSNLLAEAKTTFSFEFFPPKTLKASERLFNTIADLVPLEPSYVSVTYGAGGSTRELTHELVLRVQKETNLNVVSHLTCINSGRDEIFRILKRYQQNGIKNIMALRGDIPKGEGEYQPPKDEFKYAAELVSFIKKHFPEMCIGVAGYSEGHPETPNRLKEIEYLKAKVDQGADYICTQLFFYNKDYYDFCERCELAGIRVPIIAGIMPITSQSTMLRMAEVSLGSRYPARLLKALARAKNDDSFEKVGIHWATEQVFDLLDNGVRGIHFYTLNRSKATLSIYSSLGVTKSSGLI